jgi:hypothetical protein
LAHLQAKASWLITTSLNCNKGLALKLASGLTASGQALLFVDVQANTPGINDVVIAAHCHDDLGCSTSNSLAAAMAGAAASA